MIKIYTVGTSGHLYPPKYFIKTETARRTDRQTDKQIHLKTSPHSAVEVRSIAATTRRPITQWRFYVGARGHRPPNLAQAPKFLDTVGLLLVELIGSIVNFA